MQNLARWAFACFLLALTVPSHPSSGAEDGLPRELERWLVFSPAPEYPGQRKFDHVEGTVRLRAGVDAATGSVVRVSVVQSSGYKNLDGAAVRALRQWRFKPHTVESFVVPFTFALKGGFNQQLEAARAHALVSPSPRYPLRARYDLLQGEGVYEFMIDYDSGEVMKVNVLRSTDSVLLDEAAVSAFRQWRFTPRTLRTLRVPLRFSFYDEAHTHNNAGH